MKFRYTFLVFCLSILLFIGLSHIFIKSKALALKEEIVQINVKVIDGNPEGNIWVPSFRWKTPYLWDANYLYAGSANPDLAITVMNSRVMDTGSRYSCKSGVYLNTRIMNTLACVFTGVRVNDETVRIKITDEDLVYDDIIGSGACKIGQTCRIGQAEVSITKVPCGDEEIQVNYPSDPEYIQAYTTTGSCVLSVLKC
ncbi:MAG: hypothetical protein VKN72_07330 [Nostocales cyanobacterium 94392]|nr:hypothetical protein [Nostocales cyanobacterium 94392]